MGLTKLSEHLYSYLPFYNITSTSFTFVGFFYPLYCLLYVIRLPQKCIRLLLHVMMMLFIACERIRIKYWVLQILLSHSLVLFFSSIFVLFILLNHIVNLNIFQVVIKHVIFVVIMCFISSLYIVSG